MEINTETKKYGLIGNPLSKSLSPFLHNQFYKMNDLNNIYQTFEIDLDKLNDAVESLKILGIKGFNITIPFKEKIIEYLDEIDPLAERINAINTVKIENGKVIGYNTDGIGFIKSLEANNIDIENKNILVLGAGGGSRAISYSLLEKNIEKLYITNRTSNRGIKLANELKRYYKDKDISFTGFNLSELNKLEIDIVVNTTSVGMYPDIENSPIVLNGFSDDIILYDLIYKPLETKFLKEGKELGYKTINGIGMLYYQAIESQKIWLDKEDFLGLEELLSELNKKIGEEYE